MNSALDRIDFGILSALQKNARASNKELAATVGLAQSSCHTRLRRLQEMGAVQAMRAELDPAVVGIGLQAFVFVRLLRHDRESVLSFRNHAVSLREVVGLFHVAGRFDFILHLAVRDADHLRDVAMDAFTARPEVAQLETHLLFEVSRGALPIYSGEAD
jgi:DNA-binding Lrp family transcriptional regulator